MREIIFRGKMDDGEWVYGSFCVTYEVIGNIHDKPELLEGGGE